MLQGPEKAIKTYIWHSFEKSVNNIVTYLCKIWSKLRFPEGGAESTLAFIRSDIFPAITRLVSCTFAHRKNIIYTLQ